MLIELGNHSPVSAGLDDAPKVTTIHIPEADDKGLGGYTFKSGLEVAEFQKHLSDALLFRNGITRLPDHEIPLIVHNAWQSQGRERPAWLRVRSHEETHGEKVGHSKRIAKQIEEFLHEHFGTNGEGPPPDLEDRYWTKYGAPGEGQPRLPALEALYTNAGRVISNINDGGGQVGTTGAATASSATTLTNTGAAWTTNQWAGYRVYATVSGSQMVWGNVLSNTATVLTVDRWYAVNTPGGAAGATPAATATYLIADGGTVSTWFVAMTTTNITPAVADTALSGEYTTAGGGYIRKIAPYAQTSGVASRSITLTPVFTGNGSDVYPSTFYAIGVFASMVPGSGLMKFETALNASATVAASGDQITVTETVTGS